MQPFYGLTRLITPKIAGGLVVVLLLVLAVPVTLKLTQQRVSTTPQAAPEKTATAGTSINLVQHIFDCKIGDLLNGIKTGTDCNKVLAGKTFAVDVVVHSDIDAANLVKAQINFDPDFVSVEKIINKSAQNNPSNSNTSMPKQAADFFISLWVSNSFKNDNGTIQLIGSVPTPGFMTTSQKGATMARIYFRAKKSGNTELIMDNSSSIYRNADNQNILGSMKNLNLEIR